MLVGRLDSSEFSASGVVARSGYRGRLGEGVWRHSTSLHIQDDQGTVNACVGAELAKVE